MEDARCLKVKPSLLSGHFLRVLFCACAHLVCPERTMTHLNEIPEKLYGITKSIIRTSDIILHAMHMGFVVDKAFCFSLGVCVVPCQLLHIRCYH